MNNIHDMALSQNVQTSLKEEAESHGLKEKEVTSFVEANSVTWTLMANTWESLARDLSLSHLYMTMSDCVNFNIVKAAKLASMMSDEVINYMSKNSLACGLPAPYQSCVGANGAKALNTFLKFPKRTSLIGATWLEREARDKFWRCMDYNSKWVDNPDAIRPSYLDRYTNPWFYSSMLPHLRKTMSVLFPPNLEVEVDPFKFSNGAVQDACTNPCCKYYAAMFDRWDGMPLKKKAVDPVLHRSTNYSDLDPETFNYYLKAYPPEFQRWHQKHYPNYTEDRNHETMITPMPYSIKPQTVPKQLTSVRVIAPEDARHARLQLAYSTALNNYWERLGLRSKSSSSPETTAELFCDTNQEKQRYRCYHAVENHSATIDSTAFSDTVRRDLLRLMDNPTIDRMIDLMPTHITWGVVTRRMEMAGTMGSPCTFPTEMSVAAAGAKWSCDYSYLMGAEDSEPYKPGMVSIVGDDVMLPQWAAETFVDWLRAMSMLPNEDKSFTSGHYFESCGAEAWDDSDVTPFALWPRGMSADLETAQWDSYEGKFKSPLGSLTELANRLSAAGCESSARVLTEYIRSYYPDFKLDPDGNPGFTKGVTFPFSAINVRLVDWPKITSIHWYSEPDRRFATSAVAVKWVPSDPKKSCWCATIPSDVYRAFLERFLYKRFLKNGPMYNDALDELLGVSSPDVTRSRIHMRPVHRIVTRYI